MKTLIVIYFKTIFFDCIDHHQAVYNLQIQTPVNELLYY
jgi:hypothetical protein